MATSTTLGELPPELFLRWVLDYQQGVVFCDNADVLDKITDRLACADYKSLSLTSSQFRKFLVPTLFRTITVSIDSDRTEELSLLCDKYGRYVEQLCLQCHLHPNVQDIGDEEPSEQWHTAEDEDDITPGRLPQQFQSMLNGHGLPKMNSLQVTFLPAGQFEYDGNWDEDDQGLGSIFVHQDGETYGNVISREASFTWRATMNDVFASMAANTSIRALKLVDLLPRFCSTFWTKEWMEFLERLEDVQIELWGGDNGAGYDRFLPPIILRFADVLCRWHSNTTDGYGKFIADLGDRFFKNLKSVKRLEFVADKGNVVGCEGMRHGMLVCHFALQDGSTNLTSAPFPMRPDDLGDALESLILMNFYIDPALLAFLQARPQQLTSLHLINCAAAVPSGPSLSENGIPWSEFFAGFRNVEPALQELVVLNTVVPLSSDEQFNRYGPKEEPDEIKAVRERLRAEPHQRLFAYGYLDDKYGMVFANEEENLEYFEQGDDQREYDALMDLVAQNRASSGLPTEYAMPSKLFV